MKLNKLFNINSDLEITSLASSSQNCKEGSLFFCIQGVESDRHDYVEQAIGNGATAIVHSKKIAKTPGITYIKVDHVEKALRDSANLFYGYPSSKLFMIGATGTNGKSSITSTLRHLLNKLDDPTGYVGTIAIEYGDMIEDATLTTPDIIESQRLLSQMVKSKMNNVALEVSSQGLDLNRVDGIKFDIAVFTNLSPEHMDYHQDMEHYFQSKKKLFSQLANDATAVINIDDKYGLRLFKELSGPKMVTVSTTQEADYFIKDIKTNDNGSHFTLVHDQQEYRIKSKLLALFNVYNLVEAIVCAHIKGHTLEEIIKIVPSLPIIEGRMNEIDLRQNFKIFVDYSHTPDGFKNVYTYLKSITNGRIISVFGSAGGRDISKREVMGSVSDDYCDLIVITEDDPRDEQVEDIKDMIVSGIKNTPYVFYKDRFMAIKHALDDAKEGDSVIIFGKGLEKHQHGPFGKEPWQGDDVAVTRILKEKHRL